MNYLSYTFKLNEKKVPFKKYVSETGKVFQNLRGGLEIFQKGEGLTKKRWRKFIGHWPRSCIFIVNFKHISHLVLVFLLLTLSR